MPLPAGKEGLSSCNLACGLGISAAIPLPERAALLAANSWGC